MNLVSDRPDLRVYQAAGRGIKSSANSAGSQRSLRSRLLTQSARRTSREVAEKILFRGCRWKRRRLPRSARIALEGSGLRDSSARLFPSTRNKVTCLSPTNSAAPSPICGSPLPTAAITNVFIAAPQRGSALRRLAFCDYLRMARVLVGMGVTKIR